ncbi:alpha/beta fold hydrolase [Pseudomonas sp. Teo4]|uniref:alpha/beta fold hydrolase n=1 Tax=Pseudomonas sp. Teo4 TaxID=3064528 RepID=UPI002AB98DC1|nr:alpha/beta fold hydrolase [Pseudomonas sp. Teo4]MDZ3992249.1 2-succinyl-6-hydroxy-2,4-cyclohexadiene-1-carboxylate synthase [Pseudomonas sp. Teo4]
MAGSATTATRRRLPGTPQPTQHWQGGEGLVLAGDSWGDPAGPLVILLHGGGQTRHAWGATGKLLAAAGCHAIALDARGHGDSQWSPSGDYSTDAMVQDLKAVIASHGGRPPVLIGASMGGITSLVGVGEGRIEARALILVDVVPRCEASGVARIKAFMQQHDNGFASLDEVAEAISRYQPQRRKPASTQGLVKNLRGAPDGRLHWHWDPRYLDTPLDLVARYERLSDCARQLRLPTLLVRGAQSDVVSQEGLQDFLTLCPHAEHLSVADARHMVAGDRNDAFGKAAWDFLSRHLLLGASAS